MKQRVFGRTGIAISEIGFGTWGLGGVYYGPVDRSQGVAAVRAYLDAGGNHLDTAFAYHASEEIVGEGIRGYDRSKLVLASKSFASLSMERLRDSLPKEVEISLKDLGTDYIDLYYIHGPVEDQELMLRGIEAFHRLKERGLVRALCASVKGALVAPDVPALARRYLATGMIDGFQMIHSVLRQGNAAFFAEAAAAGAGIIARTVMESGMLTGKYPPGTTFTWPDQRSRYAAERDVILEAARDLARDLPPRYSNPAELSARFTLANPAVTGIILGGTTAEQVRRNVAIDALPELEPSRVAALREAFAHRGLEFNPTGQIEHVPSPRHGVEG